MLNVSSHPKILLGITGHESARQSHVLIEALGEVGDVKVVVTPRAKCFVNSQAQLLGDEEEWYRWQKVGDEVVHIELVRWADALVIAPLSANSLAKVAHGLCDNLLTNIIRAWDRSKPWLAAPAMHAGMWRHPFTATHITALRELGCTPILPPRLTNIDRLPSGVLPSTSPSSSSPPAQAFDEVVHASPGRPVNPDAVSLDRPSAAPSGDVGQSKSRGVRSVRTAGNAPPPPTAAAGGSPSQGLVGASGGTPADVTCQQSAVKEDSLQTAVDSVSARSAADADANEGAGAAACVADMNDILNAVTQTLRCAGPVATLAICGGERGAS